MGKLLSVIVPVYNAEKHLRQCLDSILGQTYGDIEAVLVNDCSPDGSLDICREYASKDARVKLINHSENLGTGGARASGAAAAAGEYIGWVDSDDWLDHNMFKDLIQILEENDADIAQCKHYMAVGSREPGASAEKYSILQTKDTGRVTTYTNIEAVRNLFALEKLDTVYWNKVFRKSVFDSIEMSVRRWGLEDTDTVYKLLFNTRRVIFFDKSYYYYRQHSGTHTGGEIGTEKARSTIEVDKGKLAYFADKCPELLLSCKQKLFTKYVSVCYALESGDGSARQLKREIAKEAASLYGEIKRTFPFKKRCLYGLLVISLKSNFISRVMYRAIKTRYGKMGYRYSAASARWFEAKNDKYSEL